jgi:hypothetical protein
MIIVRDVFTAKPGMASKLAAKFKQGQPADAKVRVLTDVVGQYNTVVLEWELESLSAWESMIADYMAGKIPQEMKDAMAGYTEMYLKGHREILRVVD